MGKVMNHTPAILFVSLIELEELFFIEALQLVLGRTDTNLSFSRRFYSELSIVEPEQRWVVDVKGIK